ncbi:hypothetical protein [Gaoshiqia sp. Z1-71]|uniref:hypothetical protein n=1 Tax=Gaoshiqia hydrogeniformans TaxID=3290090 RepID=UPI003BF7A5FE
MNNFSTLRTRAKILTHYPLLVLFLGWLPVRGHVAEEPEYDNFNVTIFFEQIGYRNFQALYEEPSGFYLPVDELFDFLKIYRKTSADGQVLQGYISSDEQVFEIDYPNQYIVWQGQKSNFAQGEAVMDMGVLFLRKEVLERVFGFTISFSFRSLSAKFGAPFELPLVRIMKLEKARENLRKIKNEAVYDTLIPREYHLFRLGTADWSFSTNQSKSYTGETRAGLGLGAETLGGETNIWLNYSDRYGFDKYRQRYTWRYVNNEAKLARQVQLGRISNKSIASVLSPVDGFMVTNTPTTVRRAVGDYLIAQYTEPDWTVELYINNVLVDFTNADASGFYTFRVPMVYGASQVTLRFYGPNGEERSEEKTFNMPYNMLPPGEFEYTAGGGMVLDTLNSRLARVETHYGFTRWLTAGAGIEYLSSISHPEIPFVGFTFQPVPKLIVTGDYAHLVRGKFTLNYNLPGNIMLALEYSRYKQGQKAVIYNYLEERLANLSVPVRFGALGGYARGTLRQYVYPNFTYNNGELLLSCYYRNYSANAGNYLNWTSMGSLTVYTNLSLSTKMKQNFTFRPSLQYNYSTNRLISFKTDLEKRFSQQGYLSLGFENNVLSNYRSFNLSFRYDLSFVSAYMSSYFSNRQVQSSLGGSGSFAFGGKNVHADKRSSVGRSGILIEAFIDINFNGKRDAGEPLTDQLKVRCSGGQVVRHEKDPVLFIAGMEPFVDYTLVLDESEFQNIAWRLSKKSIRVCLDPNQFKKISLPVLPMGEVSGMVLDDRQCGLGRVLVCVNDESGKLVASIQSEPDGYFTYFGLRPGKYVLSIDPQQLQILRKKAPEIPFTIRPDELGDLVDVGNVVLHREKEN